MQVRRLLAFEPNVKPAVTPGCLTEAQETLVQVIGHEIGKRSTMIADRKDNSTELFQRKERYLGMKSINSSPVVGEQMPPI